MKQNMEIYNVQRTAAYYNGFDEEYGRSDTVLWPIPS